MRKKIMAILLVAVIFAASAVPAFAGTATKTINNLQFQVTRNAKSATFNIYSKKGAIYPKGQGYYVNNSGGHTASGGSTYETSWTKSVTSTTTISYAETKGYGNTAGSGHWVGCDY